MRGGGSAFPFSYDWKKLAFETVVPGDAKQATLILGLQDSAGHADFRLPSVSVIRKQPVFPKTPPKGLMYTGHGLRTLLGVMISPGIQPGDIAVLRSWGVNLVRWQLIWNDQPNGSIGTQVTEQSIDKSLARLDTLLPLFKQAGIAVLLDMHTPPGAYSTDHYYRILTDSTWQKEFIDAWCRIATKYSGEKGVWGYDLVNEPVQPAHDERLLDWNELAEQTARIIRHIDRTHALIVEPDFSGTIPGLAWFEPLKVPGVVYSVHMYVPMAFTHQGVYGLSETPSYPGMIGDTNWNKDQIRKYLQPVVAYSKAYNVAIYVGEFSAVRWSNGGNQWLADVIDVMEENHWDWSYHAFREWQGWDAEYPAAKEAMGRSQEPTPRVTLLKSYFALNQAKL